MYLIWVTREGIVVRHLSKPHSPISGLLVQYLHAACTRGLLFADDIEFMAPTEALRAVSRLPYVMHT